MTRRPLKSAVEVLQRENSRMAPGGRVWSESPLRELGGVRLEQLPAISNEVGQISIQRAALTLREHGFGLDDMDNPRTTNGLVQELFGSSADDADYTHPGLDYIEVANVGATEVLLTCLFTKPDGVTQVQGVVQTSTSGWNIQLPAIDYYAPGVDGAYDFDGEWTVELKAYEPIMGEHVWTQVYTIMGLLLPMCVVKTNTSLTVDMADRTYVDPFWSVTGSPPFMPDVYAGYEFGYFYYRDIDSAVTVVSRSSPTFSLTATSGYNTARAKFGCYYKWTGRDGQVHCETGKMADVSYRFDPGITPVTSPPYALTQSTALASFRANSAMADVDIFGYEHLAVIDALVPRDQFTLLRTLGTPSLLPWTLAPLSAAAPILAANETFTWTSGVLTLAHEPLLNSEQVFRNGVYQAAGGDWTGTGTGSVTLIGAESGDVVTVSYLYYIGGAP